VTSSPCRLPSGKVSSRINRAQKIIGSQVPNSLDAVAARQVLVEQRIRELAAGQIPIRDPDVVDKGQRPWCMFSLQL
jgi:hypothetical protein